MGRFYIFTLLAIIGHRLYAQRSVWHSQKIRRAGVFSNHWRSMQSGWSGHGRPLFYQLNTNTIEKYSLAEALIYFQLVWPDHFSVRCDAPANSTERYINTVTHTICCKTENNSIDGYIFNLVFQQTIDFYRLIRYSKLSPFILIHFLRPSIKESALDRTISSDFLSILLIKSS